MTGANFLMLLLCHYVIVKDIIVVAIVVAAAAVFKSFSKSVTLVGSVLNIMHDP